MSKIYHYCVMYSVDTNNERYNCTHAVRLANPIDSVEAMAKLADALKKQSSDLGKITALRLTNWILLKKEKVKEKPAKSTISVADEVKILLDTIVKASEAMNYMGDILNACDMCDSKDEAATTETFEKVRSVLEKNGRNEGPLLLGGCKKSHRTGQVVFHGTQGAGGRRKCRRRLIDIV